MSPLRAILRIARNLHEMSPLTLESLGDLVTVVAARQPHEQVSLCIELAEEARRRVTRMDQSEQFMRSRGQ